jgi:hypothetical protein
MSPLQLEDNLVGNNHLPADVDLFSPLSRRLKLGQPIMQKVGLRLL